ncbi:MAG TPA: FAD-dependent monooxygenase [Casimicrobiaceae bacterium]|nr:FAD-dependent monooxygenase [Casimicrobiaceae bacterium]
MQTDVLIVGAGPTGLMLANELGRRGVRAIIVDRHSGPAQQTRAMAVQARTLEIYRKLGVAERAIELGKRATGANMWARGRRMARLRLGEIGEGLSPYPYVLMLGQDDNEAILGARLADWDMAVQWNTELIAMKQHPDHVEATLRQQDGTRRTVDAAYVAGCDGARSAVREMSGIAFPGAPYEHVFFVADTEAVGPMVPDELNVYLWREGFHLFFPMAGVNRWRVIGIIPQALREQRDLTFEALIPGLQAEAGATLTFERCSWFSTYRIHHRSAERFRDGRCFLLGDAAHIHSPVGGLGMNTGLQDAYNLGWKLALVISGRADAALLDTYASERMPVAKRLLQTTDRAFMLIVSDHSIARLLRSRVIARVAAVAMRFERVRKLAFRTVSQVGIRYPGSALSQSLAGLPESAPRAGDRLPWLQLRFDANGPIEDAHAKLDDTRFALLAIGQAVDMKSLSACEDILRVHAIPDDPVNGPALRRAGIPQPSFYVVRPDGHIGLAGATLDEAIVLRYLHERMRLADAPRKALQPSMVSSER